MPKRRELNELLADHPVFSDLDAKNLAIIAGCAQNVVFDPGETIFREGEAADTFYVLRHGRVALDVHLPGQGDLRIQTIEAGDVLGWSWLFPPYEWHFDARAIERVRAIALDGACLRKKCEENHDLGYALMKRFGGIAVERLQRTRLQLLDVYGKEKRAF